MLLFSNSARNARLKCTSTLQKHCARVGPSTTGRDLLESSAFSRQAREKRVANVTYVRYVPRQSPELSKKQRIPPHRFECHRNFCATVSTRVITGGTCISTRTFNIEL